MFPPGFLLAVPLRPHAQPRGLRCARPTMAADPPPQVKPSFYKNPSKAIEKGGGFYIPGLRGPRLRFFVSGLTVTLLTLNHLASPRVVTAAPTLATSETIAFTAALAVLVTAIADVRTATLETRAMDVVTSNTSTPASTIPSTSSTSELSAPIATTSDDGPAWAQSVVTDLTPVKSIVAFRAGRVVAGTPDIDRSSVAGAVVERVGESGRALYVADSSTLPPDVGVPALSSDPCALYAIPTREAVVVFAAPVESSLSGEVRRWLEAMAPRVVGETEMG